MRTIRFCPFLLAFTVAACGGGDAGQDTGGGEDAADAAPAVDPAQAATIAGVIRFTGTAPTPEPIDMSAEPACAEKHSEQPTQHRVAVNDNGTLRNVFVYVKEGLPERSWPASYALVDSFIATSKSLKSGGRSTPSTRRPRPTKNIRAARP